MKVAGQPRIEDVARAAGVSAMSVSRAMRDLDGVSTKTRERIIATAKTLGYAPNRIAGSLAAATSNLIAISVPTLFDAVFAEIVDGMRGPLMRAGLETMIETSDYDPAREEAWVERMLAWSPAALVVTGVDRSEGVRDRLRDAPFPVLELWDVTDSPIDLNIGVDHYKAGYRMGRHLVRLGYRRPAYVGVSEGRDPRAEKRRRGVLRAFEAVGSTYVDEVRINNAPSFKAGFDGTAAVLGGSRDPDLVYLVNDHLAFGGVAACAEAGKHVPEDIGIVGFNDLGINAVLARTLTTSRTPRGSMGLTAARLVVSRIRGARNLDRVVMPVELIVGQTTRDKRESGQAL